MALRISRIGIPNVVVMNPQTKEMRKVRVPDAPDGRKTRLVRCCSSRFQASLASHQRLWADLQRVL